MKFNLCEECEYYGDILCNMSGKSIAGECFKEKVKKYKGLREQ